MLTEAMHAWLLVQVALAQPAEDGAVTVLSATQSLDAVQQAVAAVLGLPFHKVTVGECLADCRGAGAHMRARTMQDHASWAACMSWSPARDLRMQTEQKHAA